MVWIWSFHSCLALSGPSPASLVDVVEIHFDDSTPRGETKLVLKKKKKRKEKKRDERGDELLSYLIKENSVAFRS